VAVRVYRPTEKDNKAIRARFLRRRAPAGDAPNIIHVRDFGRRRT
jgi:hypothetical protein